MHAPPQFTETIAKTYASLSRAHQRAADDLLQRPVQVATSSMDQWAARLEMSNATISRFAVALGFESYAQFRERLMRDCAAVIEPVERLRSGLKRPSTVGDTVANALDQDIRNLTAIRNSLTPEQCERAVKMILGARRVHIVGMGASAHLAALFVSALEPYHALVIPTVGSGGATEVGQRLMHVGAGDLVIALALPRYARDTIALTAFARARGCQVLGLTDRPTSPLVQHCSLTIFVHAEREMLPTSDTAALAVIEALASAVAFKAPHPVESAQRLAEAVQPWLFDTPQASTRARSGSAGSRPRRTPLVRTAAKTRSAR